MTSRIVLVIACAAFLSAALPAQDSLPAAGNLDLTGFPGGHGIYYRSGNQWVLLSSTVLMPFWDGRPLGLAILNVGSDRAISEIPGSHAGIQIANDPRPTFYLHGVNASDLYLVRAVSKEDYRELRMPVSRHFRKWAHFRAEDVADIAVTGENGDIVAIQPTSALRPGEYAIATAFEPGQYWVRLGFDFGILGAVRQ
jgi:hypothetical protein